MRYTYVPFVLLLTLLLGACQTTSEYYKESGTRFHTLYNITYLSDRPLTQSIDSVMTCFEESLNPFVPTSLISRINTNETDTLDNMCVDVITVAKRISEATDGVYDITGAPLFDIWGFGTKGGATKIATKAEIDSIRQFVGSHLISIDSVTHKLTKSDPRLTIIPSSLSKGYVTDLVAATLEAHGVEHYMVEIGGEIVSKGVNPSGKCWVVGINSPKDDPNSTSQELLSKIELCDKVGLASSGDYRNYKEIEGNRLAHTINVCSGYPAQQDILSATVIAPTCIEADAWATAFMALGLEASKALLPSHPELRVLFIYAAPDGSFATYQKGITPMPISQL